MGRRASLGSHGPERPAKPIHYAIGDSAPTLRVGQHNTCYAGPKGHDVLDPWSGAVAVRDLGAMMGGHRRD